MSAPRLKQHDTKVWYIHWTHKRRSLRKSTGETELAKAQIFFGEWLLLEQKAREELAPDLTPNDLWPIYYRQHVAPNVAGKATADYAWAKLSAHFGDTPCSQITQALVDSYVRKRATGALGQVAKPSTARRELAFLLSCLNFCASGKCRVIKKEYVPVVELPRDGAPRDRWLSREELSALFDAAAAESRAEGRMTRLERFLWLATETGARKTAIFELTWDRVDFATGVIDYNPAGRRETKKKRGRPPMTTRLREALLRAYHERQSAFVLDHPGDVRSQLRRVAEAAGVQRVYPHALRHTLATHMARNGVSVWDVAGVLAVSTKMVEKTYAKHAPESLIKAIETATTGKTRFGEEKVAFS